MKNRSKMSKAVKKMKDKKPSFVDERFWSTTPDKQGNADVVIRFLPQQDPEKEPFIMKFTHGFKENGKWFFIDCPITIGEPCPSDEYAQPYWEEDTEQSKNIAIKYSKKKQFIANIQVVNDLSKPENNGKVFLYKFGIKIFEKILDKLDPESELDEPIMVHDFLDGSNFKIKQRKVSGYVNYDKSEFYSETTPVAKTEKEMKVIFDQIRNLDEFINPKKFSSYTEIKKKFIGVVGTPAAEFFADTDTGTDSHDSSEIDTQDKSEAPSDDKEDAKEDISPKEKSINEDDSKASEENEEEKVEKKDDDFDFDFDVEDDDFSFDDNDEKKE